ncbi:MAG: DNA-binding domain-containing protein [Bacteriovoracaceae bacterium]|nr:DNA-binding domain-containing protein [Bacteriovoracaceae bacterium]
MQLKKIQQLFVDTVTSRVSSVELVGIIDPGGSLTAEGALKVYAMDYKARMQEALGKNYEATWLVLGDDEFLTYAEEYISLYPSDLTNLTSYGDHFPNLLTSKEVAHEVYQMAVFEREFWRFFHANQSPPIELTQEVLGNAYFDLSGIIFFETEMRLDIIWQNRELGSESLGEFDLYEICYLAMFKAGEKVEVKKLSKKAYQLLEGLKEVGRVLELSAGEYDPNEWAEALSVLMFSKLVVK